MTDVKIKISTAIDIGMEAVNDQIAVVAGNHQEGSATDDEANVDDDQVVTISEVIGELEASFDDGETIEDKANGALMDIPRTEAIHIMDQLEQGSRRFASLLKNFMADKPCSYVITGGDMKGILSEFRTASSRDEGKAYPFK